MSEEAIQDAGEGGGKEVQETAVEASEQPVGDIEPQPTETNNAGEQEAPSQEPVEGVESTTVEPSTDEPAAEEIADKSEGNVEVDAQENPDSPATEGQLQEGVTEPSGEAEGEVTGEVEGEVEGEVDEASEGDVQEEAQEDQSDTEDADAVSLKYEPQEGVQEEEPEAHPLDELTDQQVIDLVQEIETENRHLGLENILFESFLKENDPSLLEGLDGIMNYCMARSSSILIVDREPLEKRRSTFIDRNRFKLDSYTSITSIAEGKGPKINLSQKTDMIMRAMEESQTSLEAFLKKCNIIKRNLKAELEEYSIREAEIKEATDIFEYSVVTQGVDKLTQRIPAEKFIRYMEEWLKSAQLQIEKLRLRIATLKVQYKKVSQQLIQRQELGENVHAVDFDQLEIENKHFVEKIEQKNIHLVELKKMNGGANLVLSTHKKFLQKQQEDCNKLKVQIAEKNKQIAETEVECQLAEDELNAEIEKYENCKNLKNQYTVPDVMEYVRLKDKLHELRKNVKIWVRRKKIQDIALNTCLREMKNLTGNTDVDPTWFEDMQSASEESGSEEMLV